MSNQFCESQPTDYLSKMWVQTVWHWICILVFLSGLIDLLLSKDKVFYQSGHRILSEAYQIGVCLKIESTLYNCSSLKGENLLVCERLKSYFELVESGKLKTPQEIIRQFEQTTSRSNDQFPTLFKFEADYKFSQLKNYLNLNHFCFRYKVLVDQYKVNKSGSLQFAFFNKFHLTLKLFLFPGRLSRYNRYEYLRCENFKSCYYFDLSVLEYRSVLLPSSSDADCLNYRSRRFYFQGLDEIKSRSSCLQECLKYRYRFSEFFYSENDTDLIEFNKTEHYELLDSTYSHHFAHCKGQCQKPSCTSRYFNFLGIIYKKQNMVVVNVRPNSVLFEAIPNMQPFEFWRKFLGFISLFFKTSLLSLVLKANKILRSKMQQDDSKPIFSCLLVLVWVCLVSGLYYGSVRAKMIYDQYNKTDVTAYWFFEVPFVPGNFSVAICEAVKRNPKEPLSLAKLSTPAKRFNESNFFVKFGIIERNLILSRVQHFYRSLNQTNLEHCFATDVYIKEPR